MREWTAGPRRDLGDVAAARGTEALGHLASSACSTFSDSLTALQAWLSNPMRRAWRSALAAFCFSMGACRRTLLVGLRDRARCSACRNPALGLPDAAERRLRRRRCPPNAARPPCSLWPCSPAALVAAYPTPNPCVESLDGVFASEEDLQAVGACKQCAADGSSCQECWPFFSLSASGDCIPVRCTLACQSVGLPARQARRRLSPPLHSSTRSARQPRLPMAGPR